jgi:hypothetical protein
MVPAGRSNLKVARYRRRRTGLSKLQPTQEHPAAWGLTLLHGDCPRFLVKWGFDPFVDERYAITWGLSLVSCPWFLAFCPNGAQGESPGQRPVGLNVEIESRPEGAELNGEEIHGSSYPGRRFALPWAISFCPVGAGKQKTPTARGLSPVSCHDFGLGKSEDGIWDFRKNF